uniref:Uncharacterized protein n=1 Tax=Glossina palpalis gambiensis TaxID=67801 RepID=A0A1B0BFP3_9MUSC
MERYTIEPGFVKSLPFDGTKSVVAVSDVGMEVLSIRVLLPSGASLNKAYSSESSGSGGVIVGYAAGLECGAIQGAKFSHRATSKDNKFEIVCNELAADRQVAIARDGGAGSVILSNSSGKPDDSQDADTDSVPLLTANER